MCSYKPGWKGLTKIAHPLVKNPARAYRRGSLLSTLENETLLTRVKISDNESFFVETKSWDFYWQPIRKLGSRRVEENLDALYSAWHDYIRSGFYSLLRQEFCFRYFSLLDVLLSICVESNATQSWLHALHTALGFECFGITSSASDSEVLGASTCTIRNPCYLLAKLKMPNALDDPQFLPIITVAGTNEPGLFYHYRQYNLSLDSPASLIFYPAVSEDKRSTSFRLINSLAGGVSYGIDPRTHERAKRLYQKIVRPILETDHLTDFGSLLLEFVDVGAGSGGLTSVICRQIHDAGFKLKFRLWFVDLEPADPARFFSDKKSRAVVDSLSYLGDDYRSWLSRDKPLPAANGLRIALVSRLFNNMSRISIHRINESGSNSLFKKMAISPDSDAHLPHRCLAPGGKGLEALVVSNIRLALTNGRTFAQASLSDYYRGMYIISRQKSTADIPEGGLFLPVRSFNPNCLVTSAGVSVLSCLVDNCDYIIIEDADLRPQDLIEHMKTYSLHSMHIQDMTEALGLTGNYAYVILSHSKPEKEPAFGGKCIW
jgi:hypothetical protein